MKRWIFRGGLSLGVAAAFLLGLEALCRLAEPRPFRLFDRSPFVEDRDRGWRLRPNFRGSWDSTPIETNALGFRGPEVPDTREPGEVRILCLGDSCTLGKGVAYADTYPARLEAALGARDPSRRWRVVNGGVNGYSIPEYDLVRLSLSPRVEPDVLILGLNVNDFPNAVHAVQERMFEQRTLRRWFPFRDSLGRFALFRFLRQSYYESRRDADWKELERLAAGVGEDPAFLEAWKAAEAELGAIVEGARASGARPLLFMFPYESQVYLAAYAPAPIEKLAGFARERKVPFVDLLAEFRAARDLPTLPGERAALFLRGDRYHPSPRGHRIAAEAILRALEKEGSLPHRRGA